MNTKIRSTLALLKRMGIVNSINDEPEDMEFESSLPYNEPETNPVSIFFFIRQFYRCGHPKPLLTT